jgi:hypothetical protein
MSLAIAAYVLSAITCILCALLLLRGYGRTRQRLLLWSGLCFVGLAAENALLFVDVVVVPEVSLLAWRGLPALCGLCALLYGLIWEAR